MIARLLSLLKLLVMLAKYLNLVLRQLSLLRKYMPAKPNPNQPAVDAAVAEVTEALQDAQATLVEEATELDAIIDDLDPAEPISVAGIKSLKEGIAAFKEGAEKLSEGFAPKPPDAGKFTASLVATSNNRANGGENMRKSVKDENCSAEQRDRLKLILTAGVQAAQAVAGEPKQGEPLQTRVTFDDGVNPVSVTLTSELQIAVFDLAVSLATGAAAQQQIDAIRNPNPA